MLRFCLFLLFLLQPREGLFSLTFKESDEVQQVNEFDTTWSLQMTNYSCFVLSGALDKYTS